MFCWINAIIAIKHDFVLGFQHFPRDLANVNEWKIMFDPSIKDIYGLFVFPPESLYMNF